VMDATHARPFETAPADTAVPVLQIVGLSTQFPTRTGVTRAVDDVSLTVSRGEILGLVGESGSGKSVTGLSIMGLVEDPGKIVAGKILFNGEDLSTLSSEGMRRLRGKRIAMIFQDPMMTLNPVLTIETQMIEAILAHEHVPKHEARSRARDALGIVGIPSPDERLSTYPHMLSGGMRQRVVIAIALLHNPDLIIADEPTTALDVTIQAQILAEVQRLCRERHTALIWVTHDLAIVSRLADRIAVMYAGRVVETGDVAATLTHPRHPYTAGLINSEPSRNQRGQRLAQIPGMMSSSASQGCAFRPRCARATAECAMAPPMFTDGGQAYRCFHPLENTPEAAS
jgi:peptide/nickel transport system ATP-binding protein